jgi:hypothetical protein
VLLIAGEGSPYPKSGRLWSDVVFNLFPPSRDPSDVPSEKSVDVA